LVGAQQQAKVLQANDEQATANVMGLEKQVAFHQKRLDDIAALTKTGVATPFHQQDTREQLDVALAQLQAAKAAQLSTKAALDSTIGGVNSTVVQTRAQLDDAKWELAQTTIKAPSDGYVSSMALAVGARALQARAAASLIVISELTIVGTFSQIGFHTIKSGTPAKLVFDNDPGRIHDATITIIPEGIGEGQIAVSGMLARISALGGTSVYPAEISIPNSADRAMLRLGMSGTATVFAENAGVIGLIARILLWVRSYTAYL
jgi:multidrug resistance efflux pump